MAGRRPRPTRACASSIWGGAHHRRYGRRTGSGAHDIGGDAAAAREKLGPGPAVAHTRSLLCIPVSRTSRLGSALLREKETLSGSGGARPHGSFSGKSIGRLEKKVVFDGSVESTSRESYRDANRMRRRRGRRGCRAASPVREGARPTSSPWLRAECRVTGREGEGSAG